MDAAGYLAAAERAAWQVPDLAGVAARPVRCVAVIGAGTMGAGIAGALADHALDVLLLDRDADAIEAGMARVRAGYARDVQRGRLEAVEIEARLARIVPIATWDAVGAADLVIEAAFEDAAVKADIFRRLDAVARPGAVLATNTSYLDLDAIAAVTGRASDVIGLHFFAPARLMRLLEIVRGAKTSPEVLATGLALAATLAKQPVVARVREGFIGNRIYAAYRRHAEYLVEDGATPADVDAALEAYGFAMGIFAVSDLSGLDIAYAMRKRLAATRDPGERVSTIADRLCEAGRLGRKTGAGWYGYDAAGQRRPDPAVDAVIAQARAERGITARPIGAAEIQRRLLAVMANEGARVLDEGVALRGSDIDVAFVNGYGFPRARGGPMFAADQLGAATALQEMQLARAQCGTESTPAARLAHWAAAGTMELGNA